jgi:hypothetical protein
VQVAKNDIWEGNINVENVGLAGNLLKVTQLELNIEVIAVLGKVLTLSVSTPGANYALGDYAQLGTIGYYQRCIVKVTGVSGTGITTLSVVDGGLGYLTGGPYPITRITGSGGGGYATILTVST